MKERQIVRIILLDPANRILLLKISPNGSMDPKNPIKEPFWITPGGEIEKGETIQQAIFRELKEETGITQAKIYESAAWYGQIILERKGVPTLFKQFFFLVRADTNQVNMENIGQFEKEFVIDYRWWTLKQIKSSKEIFVPISLKTSLEPLLSSPPEQTQIIDLSV